LDAKTGTEKWEFEAGDSVRSTPAVSDGVAYVGSDDGYLYALK
jgi:outer membrane protein assembly factor BamB